MAAEPAEAGQPVGRERVAAKQELKRDEASANQGNRGTHDSIPSRTGCGARPADKFPACAASPAKSKDKCGACSGKGRRGKGQFGHASSRRSCRQPLHLLAAQQVNGPQVLFDFLALSGLKLHRSQGVQGREPLAEVAILESGRVRILYDGGGMFLDSAVLTGQP